MGTTISFMSGVFRDSEIVEMLIEQGADISERDDERNTPLIKACVGGAPSNVIKLLLDAGADVNAVNNAGKSALFYAICLCDADVVRLLLDAGADVHHKDNTGKSPFIYATPFFARFSKIATDSLYDKIKLMLESGADVDERNEDGTTLLIEYARPYPEHVAVVSLLLKYGANINAQDKGGCTPLITASIDGIAETVKELLQAGADMTIHDNKGKSALDYALEGGDVEIINLLKNPTVK